MGESDAGPLDYKDFEVYDAEERALSKQEIDWLRSLCRMNIRKTGRELEHATRHPQQSEDDFQAFMIHLNDRLTFKQSTLAHLEEMSRACSGDDK
jgi:hypothetical protein